MWVCGCDAQDGLIHKEELIQALFNNDSHSLFSEQVSVARHSVTPLSSHAWNAGVHTSPTPPRVPPETVCGALNEKPGD